jgi:putative ABC transport system permease protein
MNPLKIMKLSLNMLMHSKLRSWLTILGIFIGVAAVVAIISIGNSLQASVNNQISGLGQDLITISSGSSRAFGFGGEGGGRASSTVHQLSDKDLNALKLVPGIKAVNSIVSGRATISYQTENTSLSIQGYDPSVFKGFIMTDLALGRYLNTGDTRVAVIGDRVANTIFSRPVGVGSTIELNSKPFKVVGILVPITGFGGSDSGIYIPTKDARDVLNNTLTLSPTEYSSIVVKVTDPNNIAIVSTNVENALINSHHVTKNKEDFSITTAQALQQRFSTVTSALTLFLGVIAAVSLLVGGIGVANTMFTSVLEKTRDIGVMKAIGAKNSDIMFIFLFNSGMLGLVGGVLGTLFGVLITYALPYFGVSLGFGPGSRGGLTTVIDLPLLIFSIVFSIAIGMISGAIPAYRASKLKPVEALRYE